MKTTLTNLIHERFAYSGGTSAVNELNKLDWCVAVGAESFGYQRTSDVF